jgi:hypothetical protein
MILFENSDKEKTLPSSIVMTAIEYQHTMIEDDEGRELVYFQLKGRGSTQSAVVSKSRWETVRKYKWYLAKSGYVSCYELGKMTLHRFVFSYIFGQPVPSELYVDHIDRNKLNNTDHNLRLVTPQENSFNRSTSSNLKGVKKISKGNYSVTVVKDGTRHVMKDIPTKEQAAEMYNLMAEELFGVFSAPNQLD